ncbi:hypothetical protein [Chondromyces crocatus]|uniref:Uncharacterized protein n=1 Tax=Chondromyces crocatus TaxID=52 RepID=A0A0K1E6Q1_CHOCO|nr:hypothetical protein [Chondromyces crocatus]AKT36550.1 uncharacterized protein CMC5_006680 [Chondromyces crocatus]
MLGHNRVSLLIGATFAVSTGCTYLLGLEDLSVAGTGGGSSTTTTTGTDPTSVGGNGGGAGAGGDVSVDCPECNEFVSVPNGASKLLVAGDFLYWSTTDGSLHAQRKRLSDTQPNELQDIPWSTESGDPNFEPTEVTSAGLVVTQHHLWWASHDRLGRALLDDQEMEIATFRTANIETPSPEADPERNKIAGQGNDVYWTQGASAIWSIKMIADLGGGGVNESDVVVDIQSEVSGLARADSKTFWAEYASWFIYAADEFPPPDLYANVGGVMKLLTSHGNRISWMSVDDKKICVSDPGAASPTERCDGVNANDIINRVGDLASDGTCIYWTIPDLGMVYYAFEDDGNGTWTSMNWSVGSSESEEPTAKPESLAVSDTHVFWVREAAGKDPSIRSKARPEECK